APAGAELHLQGPRRQREQRQSREERPLPIRGEEAPPGHCQDRAGALEEHQDPQRERKRFVPGWRCHRSAVWSSIRPVSTPMIGSVGSVLERNLRRATMEDAVPLPREFYIQETLV